MLRSCASSICQICIRMRLLKLSGSKPTHHDDTVSAEQGVHEGLTEEHAVCHISYTRPFLAADIFKPNGITDLWSDGVRAYYVEKKMGH